MANEKPGDGGMVNRLAGRGEEAVTRLVEELGKNPRVTDALGRAMSAKGKIDQSARGALSQVGLAAADELKELRKQIERLERRLAKLESSGGAPSGGSSGGSKPTAKKSETKKAPTAKKATTTKTPAAKAPSPSPGRAIGGGTGRGTPGGTAS
jgi:polyhydroxyalkanoate synthesis regulator phasin